MMSWAHIKAEQLDISRGVHHFGGLLWSMVTAMPGGGSHWGSRRPSLPGPLSCPMSLRLLGPKSR